MSIHFESESEELILVFLSKTIYHTCFASPQEKMGTCEDERRLLCLVISQSPRTQWLPQPYSNLAETVALLHGNT